ALLLAPAGCISSPAPPAPHGGSFAGGGVSVNYLWWDAGLKVLLVDDIDSGSRQSTGSGSNMSPVYTTQGSATAPDGRTYTWKVEAATGRTGKLSIQGQNYDLAKGALVVVRTKGGSVQVIQIHRDLSALPDDLFQCHERLLKDAEVMKAVETGEAPKQGR